jgi:PAS domain S-box-containing protein
MPDAVARQSESIHAADAHGQPDAAESAAVLQSFYDTAPMMMGVVEVLDDDLRHLSDNAATAAFLGVEPGSTRGRTARELGVPADHVRNWIERYRAAEATGRPVHFEYDHTAPSGVYRMSATVSFIGRSADGTPRFSYVVQDDTARLQALIYQQFMSEVDDKLRRLREPAEILGAVAEAVGRHFGASRAFFAELRANEADLVVQEEFRRDCASVAGAHPLSSLGPDAIVDALRHGHNVSVADTALDPRTAGGSASAYEPIGVRAFAVAPCMRDDRCVAVLVLHAAQPRRWSPAETRLLETIARRAWPAVENARLNQAAERDALLLRNVRDAVIVTDMDGIVTYWNEGATRLFGWSAAEMIGRSHTLRFPEPMRPAVQSAMQAITEGDTWDGEFEDVRKDGARIWIDARTRRIDDRAGRPIGLIGISHDITERKLEEIRRRFLAEASDVLASSLDYQTTLQSVARLVVPYLADWCAIHLANDAGSLDLVTAMHADPSMTEAARQASLRYPPRMDVPRGPGAVFLSGTAQWTEHVTDAMIRAVSYDDAHYRLLSASGMTSYMCVPLAARGRTLGTITFVGAESGHRYTAASLPLAEELAQRAATAVDNARLYAEAQKELAERQLAEAALEQSRDHYRTLTEALPHLVWTTDPQGVPDYFNPRWLAYTGQDPTDGHAWWTGAVHPDDLANTMERWTAAVNTGEPYEVEYRLRGADGEYRWFLARGIPLKSARGEVAKWFGTCTDIDVQKRAELEIASLNARLRRSIQETHHRVKNNLQIVAALADLQLEDGQATVPSSALARIGQHTRSLAAMHDLLTHAARADTATDVISTRAALDNLVPLLQTTTGDREIHYSADDVELSIQAGASLALLVSEIVSNAIKHGRGEIVLTLTARDGVVTLSVCDDGPGFPPGFDWRAAAGTGLMLIDSTGRYDLRGAVTYGNRPEGGACVTAEFPAG